MHTNEIKPIKLEIIFGSPRQNGNTFQIVNILMDKLSKTNYQVHITSLYNSTINPCIDCRACKINNLSCSCVDAMTGIYKSLELADFIIFASPIYWYGPSAKTKLCIDRLRPYFLNRKLENKHAALILTAAEGKKDCGLCLKMFQRVFTTLGINYLGELSAKAYNIGDIMKDKKIEKKVHSFVQKMNTCFVNF